MGEKAGSENPIVNNYQPNHTLEDMKVVVLKAGQVNQEYRKKQEMRFIFWARNYGPEWSKSRLQFHVNSPFCPLAHWRALSLRTVIGHVSYFNELFNGFPHSFVP